MSPVTLDVKWRNRTSARGCFKKEEACLKMRAECQDTIANSSSLVCKSLLFLNPVSFLSEVIFSHEVLFLRVKYGQMTCSGKTVPNEVQVLFFPSTHSLSNITGAFYVLSTVQNPENSAGNKVRRSSVLMEFPIRT